MAARRKGGSSFSVSVDGLSELEQLPGWIDRGQREFLDKATTRLRDAIRMKAPGGPAGRIGRDIESRTLTSTRGVIRSRGLPATRALERGAFIRARKGRAIRFEVHGRVVFVRAPRGVRLKPHKFFEAGLRQRGKIVRGAYTEAFADLEKHRGSS